LGYKLSYKGTETINGAETHKLIIESPQGDKETSYFDAQTGFLLRTIEATEGGTATTDFSDYKAIEGISTPYKVTISGLLPIPLEFKVKSIVWNKGIDDAKFKIE
jgi:outer membrane lipoprotein-sorting protein